MIPQVKFEYALNLENLAGASEREGRQARAVAERFNAQAMSIRRDLTLQIGALFPGGYKQGRPLVRYKDKTYRIMDSAIVEMPVENLD
ncbi:hypothetical protein LCGC14_2158670 [marine sediment metagenome]|uniref:Uncharacterized protein n=1 Tax=marine sediment metagenome TaxID=412755 RepID=A0A0F9G6A0_9ZZZZ